VFWVFVMGVCFCYGCLWYSVLQSVAVCCTITADLKIWMAVF